MARFLIRSLFIALVLSTLLGALSWPLIGAIHARLGLSAPPMTGLIVLGGGIVLALVGSSLIGRSLGQLGGRNPAVAMPFLAALASLVWGGCVVATVAPLYAGSVTDAMTRDGSALLWRERGHITQHARETVARVQRGESRQAATDTGRELYDKTKTIALRGAAMLPAFLLLGWAVLIPPFLGAGECRRARK